MAIKRPKPEEIVVKLRQGELLMGQGMPWIGAIDNCMFLGDFSGLWRQSLSQLCYSFIVRHTPNQRSISDKNNSVSEPGLPTSHRPVFAIASACSMRRAKEDPPLEPEKENRR